MTTVAATVRRGPIHLNRQDCSTAGNVTRSLLGYLALAGQFYVVVSLAQALTRSGFHTARDEWSLLALGHLGWIQQANLALTGAMLVAGAIGVRRALGLGAAAGTWAPRLLAGYGLALFGAGSFRPDAADGLPPTSPAGHVAHTSGHGMLHLLFGSLGFACLIVACFVLAHGYQRRGHQRAVIASRAVGIVFAVAFAGIATGAGTVPINLAFTAAVVISSGWLTAIAVDLYRVTRTAHAGQRAVPAAPATSEGRLA